MSKKGSYAVCRTCLNDSFSFSNIFKELLKGEYVYEILKDVCQLEVNVDDGLPEYVCFDCHKKLSEFHSFKLLTHKGNAALQQIKYDLEHVPSSPGRMSIEGRLNMPEGAEEEKREDRPFQMNVQGVGNGMRDVCAQNSIFKVNESGGEVTKIQDWNTEIRIVPLTNLSGPSELYDSDTERNENIVTGSSEEGDSNACSSEVIAPANSVCEEPKPAEEYGYSEGNFIKSEHPVDIGVNDKNDSEVESEGVISKFSGAVSHIACGDLVDKEVREIIDSEGELWEGEREEVIPKLSEGGSHKAYANFNASISDECGNLTSKEKCHSLDTTSVKSEPLEGNEPGVSPSNNESLYSQNEEENGIDLDLLVCDHCGKEFLDKTTLLKHLDVHFEHSDIGCSMAETVPPGGGRKRSKKADGQGIKCGWCGKGFTYPYELKNHEIMHTGDKPFACKFCPKKFSRRTHLRDHEYLHTGEKPFACQKCDKRYCDKRGLRNHQRSHLDEKQFECVSCDKKFTHLVCLRNHQKLHDKNRIRFRCNFCDKEFNCKRSLDIHVSIHLGEERYKCRYCGKVLTTKSYLKTHELIHTREFPFNCDICKMGFATRTLLRFHEETHYGEGPHKCGQCPSSFIHQCSLRRHVRNVHVKPFRCGWCEKSFTRRPDMRNHEKMHGKQRQQSSGKAENLSGPSELYLSGAEINGAPVDGLSEEGDSNACSRDVNAPAHTVSEEPRPAEEYSYSEGIFIKSEHPVDIGIRDKNNSVVESEDVISKFSKAVSLTACGDLVDKEIREEIDSEGELCEGESEDVDSKFPEEGSHKVCANFNASISGECGNLASKEKCHSLDTTSVKSKPLEENEPGVSPSNNESLYSQNEEENGIDLGLLVCDHCGKEFLDKTTLLKHLDVHFERSDIGCSMGETVPAGGGRKRRKRAVNKDVKCGWCGKGFTYPYQLKSHEIKHTGEKPFACKFCPKKFSRSIRLRNHEYLHTGEKPFACQKCDKRYCDKRGLIVHLKSHLNERQFECDSCDKKFNRLLHLKRHRKLHDKNRMRFRCNFCDKEFKCKSSLDIHVSMHLGEERFKCRFCGKVFCNKSYMKRHELLHTRESPFNCNICKKGFATRAHLSYHEETRCCEGPRL